MMADGQSTDNTERANQDVAVYECICGDSVMFPESRWNALRYMARKMGYENPSEFVTQNRSCCDRPDYMEVSAYRSLNSATDRDGGAD